MSNASNMNEIFDPRNGDDEHFGVFIKDVLKKLGATQTDLADVLGVHRSTVSKILSSEMPPKGKKLKHLIKAIEKLGLFINFGANIKENTWYIKEDEIPPPPTIEQIESFEKKVTQLDSIMLNENLSAYDIFDLIEKIEQYYIKMVKPAYSMGDESVDLTFTLLNELIELKRLHIKFIQNFITHEKD